ncbi:NUDIX hydrolase [Lysinibacillus fusiformis]|uniref:8-oxo-dGTP pyrophosphatase MutT, NUDIX family n=1 Tax=Lysinibacillus fusiformis TaxID=28031 RepID=A0A1H9KCB2_9BACI|nr:MULTISPECIES: NUDIX domain-containing protein [Lysinibacillus]MED4669994.1 NUDIX domain-containing protein [Lysinibacillus fusiformis]QAS56428.1 NUDIX domain-containing protein [Lysinibacillus sphaericus]RDV31411.1 NUDIX domain-containing protein [Lysinibacillus fusiformis]SCY48773.1 8-oxo-dGTP pyrophosphatase MutT, NUDIX family [Lysinibacillus fusiformis]SEN83254.1 8-oxo-dGTP pyrophosphatase MutT, NUDIX family [Lysinibacillus fusiformis]
MEVVEKAFGYITREHGEQIQVLVFEQNTVGAGIQVPKGTIEQGETPLEAVKREMLEETGLTTLVVQGFIAQDYFNHPSGVLQKRYFYHLTTSDETMETWQHYPTGLNEADLLFSFYWISAEQDTLLAKGHGDYLYRLLAKVKN